MLSNRDDAIAELRTVSGIGPSTGAVLYDDYQIDSLHRLGAVLRDERSIEKLLEDEKIKASEATLYSWLAQVEEPVMTDDANVDTDPLEALKAPVQIELDVYTVQKGHSLSSNGMIFSSGDEIRRDQIHASEEGLARLVSKGIIA